MPKNLLLRIFLLCLLPICALSQQGMESSLRQKWIKVQTDTLQFDSLSVVPGSIQITGSSAEKIWIDATKARLSWKNLPELDSVKISYRVFPFSFHERYFHKDAKRIEQNMVLTPYYYNATDVKDYKTFIDFGNVDYSGSFGRMLSFGNSQDVVLNSQFNLQLDGDLGDSIKLTGAITDNTIPFQPEGNTQQLQEFDKVFIKLQRKRTSIIAGDYDIKKPSGYFMNFYKRVQGGYFSTATPVGKKGENRVGFGASLAKGKFVRNVITALEGNQGPYKLTGPNGEQFFVVLAGTERVYIDGIQMQRGENLDYVIDYNTAEITFMPRRIITKDLRITAEFEFFDRNYLNSLFYLNDEWQVNKKLQLRFNAYSNQDAKNQPLQQSLDSSQKRFLAQIGDSIQKAFYPSVQFVDTFSNSKILYRKTDTLANGILYPNVYVFSTDPDSAKYALSFSYMGQGNGHYRQAINSANGRVYAWIAPENGLLQGDYEPIMVLVTPKKLQLFSLAGTYAIDSQKTLNIETALSNSDPNTFSDLHNETHNGLAARLVYDERRLISSKRKMDLYSKVSYEFVQDRFRALERFRNVEFNRDWNINPSSKPQNEHLGFVSLSLRKENLGKLDYQFGTYLRGNDFKGSQHILGFAWARNGYRVLAKGDIMSQSSNTFSSTFYRPYFEAEKQIKALNALTGGLRFLLEHNEWKNAAKDSLQKTAFSFDALTFYLKNNVAAANNFSAEYTLRHDRGVKDNRFQQSTEGHTFSLNTVLASIKNQEVKLTAAYRILSITDTTITPLKPDESLLGRLEYNFTLLKNVLSGNLLYEFGSGQEPKREFTYVEVPVGQGLYVWRDYNQDNLKQLNEFEIAIFPDEKRYIKIFTPTNQYVKAKYSVYTQAISLNPKSLLTSTDLHGIKKIISLFYLQSAVQLNNRFIGREGIGQYNPFIRRFEDSLLINNSSSMINSVFLNRFGNTWGLDYIQTLNGGKSFMNYGVDARRMTEDQIRGRYNIKQSFTLTLGLKQGKRTFSSQFLENRSYLISYRVAEPGFTVLFFKNQLRLQSFYRFDVRQNKEIYGGEKSTAHNINVDLKYNTPGSGSISLKTTYAAIQFSGTSNSTVGYTMLDGLLPGKNWLWQAGFERRISRNVEMSLEYEGRKPANNPVIHTGRASVRAIF
ncbi:MAG: hypothetical protein JNJ58_14500 [Chitinophagaceae bacterium]|nr:hypothetical protein [Chitinophagaceae bacterium]